MRRQGGRDEGTRAGGGAESRLLPLPGPGVRKDARGLGVVAGDRANGDWSAASPLPVYKPASRFDAVLLQRKLLPGWQLRELRKADSRRLIFDFDDAVLYRDSYDRRGPHHRRRSDRFQRTVQMADTVIAGNDFLADCALKAGAQIPTGSG